MKSHEVELTIFKKNKKTATKTIEAKKAEAKEVPLEVDVSSLILPDNVASTPIQVALHEKNYRKLNWALRDLLSESTRSHGFPLERSLLEQCLSMLEKPPFHFKLRHLLEAENKEKTSFLYFILPLLIDSPQRYQKLLALARQCSKVFILSELCEGNNPIEKIKAAQAKGLNLDERDMTGKTLAHYAAANGVVSVLKYLDESGANNEIPDNELRFPCHDACLRGQVNAVKFFLTSKRAAAVAKIADGKGITPLHLACENGFYVVVELFVNALKNTKQEVDINDCNNATPFHYAMQKKNYVVAYLLLTHGAVATPANINDLIQWAMELRRFGVVENLLKNFNADPTVVDKNGSTLLALVAVSRELSLVKKILETGRVDKVVYAAALELVRKCYEEAMQYRAEAGWTPRFADEDKIKLREIVECLELTLSSNEHSLSVDNNKM